MKLKEYLEKLDSEELVYIGFENGTNWVVIDKVGVVLSHMDELENICYKQIKGLYDRACKKLIDYPSLIMAQISKVENFECINGKEPKSKRHRGQLSDLKEVLREKETAYVAAYMSRKKTEKELLGWVPFWNRKIVETYEQDEVLLKGKCIVVEGFCNGKLWWYGEQEIFKEKKNARSASTKSA